MSEHKHHEIQDQAVQEQGSERLSRFLAHAGVASRRRAEELISAGRVQVNGQTILTQGIKIDALHDQVHVDGRLVQPVTEHVYILLNKPAGYVCTARDPQGRPTVLDLLPDDVRRLRVYPVGRLDIDTSGLLLLTNDGEFALHMAHPRYSTEKCYEVLVRGRPTPQALEALQHGVKIREDDGGLYQTSPAQARFLKSLGPDSLISLTIHEGHKRQVRRMFDVVGYPVQRLARVSVGPLTAQGLPIGRWRHLTSEDLQLLKKLEE